LRLHRAVLLVWIQLKGCLQVWLEEASRKLRLQEKTIPKRMIDNKQSPNFMSEFYHQYGLRLLLSFPDVLLFHSSVLCTEHSYSYIQNSRTRPYPCCSI